MEDTIANMSCYTLGIMQACQPQGHMFEFQPHLVEQNLRLLAWLQLA